MLLGNDEEAVLHHGHGRISRQVEEVEASTRGREVRNGTWGHANSQAKRQSSEALHWKMLN